MTNLIASAKQKKNKIFTVIQIIILATLCFAESALASSYQSHQQILDTATNFVRSQIPENISIKEVKAGRIDSRIRFKTCSQPLEANSTMHKTIAKNWTINVRCYGDIPWSIYIPVKARLSQKVLLSKTTITRGETITADKIKLVDYEIKNSNQHYFSDPANITGLEARRTIRPDRLIISSMLQKALLVHRKESVLIFARNSKIQISMKGTALKNGHYNEVIKVRNNSSKKIIEALVTDRGVVSVNF